jgi:hypothetical protein
MLYQCLAIDLNYWLSGETGGIESGGNDRDGSIDLHQNTALDPITRIADTQVPFFGRKLA